LFFFGFFFLFLCRSRGPESSARLKKLLWIVLLIFRLHLVVVVKMSYLVDDVSWRFYPNGSYMLQLYLFVKIFSIQYSHIHEVQTFLLSDCFLLYGFQNLYLQMRVHLPMWRYFCSHLWAFKFVNFNVDRRRRLLCTFRRVNIWMMISCFNFNDAYFPWFSVNILFLYIFYTCVTIYA